MILHLYGLSGSGKSTLAEILVNRIDNCYVLDGDILREGLCSDLGFSAEDRSENVRRAIHCARILSLAGKNVIIAMITPYHSDREMVREICSDVDYLGVFIDTPLEVCEKRDVKGLYKKARAGTIKNFTGLDDPFEKPVGADYTVFTRDRTPEESSSDLLEWVSKSR